MKKIFSLENFIYAVIFLLPVYLVKLSLFGMPTNLLEILIALAFIWALSAKISFKNFLKPSFGIAIWLIFVGLLISTLTSKNYIAGFGIIKGWFLLPLLFAVIVKNIISKEKIKNVYQALYFSATAVSMAGLAYYFLGGVTFDGRLQAFFNSPNYLAMYLAPAIIIGLLLRENFEFRISNFGKAAHWVSFAIILTAFYLTYSYAAWGAVILSAAVVEFIRNKNKINIKKTATIVFLVAAVILSQWSNPKFTDFKNIAERSSFQSRIMIWKTTGKILEDNFIFGIGPGNFQSKYLEYQKYFPPYLEWAVPHPHNIFLAFWLYSGLIGLAGFIFLVLLWLKEILKIESEIKYIALGIVLYILIHGLADTTYFKNDLAVVFWLSLTSSVFGKPTKES